MHMHNVGVIVLDPSGIGGGFSIERLKRLILSRRERLSPFFRKVCTVPFNFEHPYWVQDHHFDMDYHVRRMTIAAPGGNEELGKLVGELASKPLDRSRPLWELWVIEGLENGHVGLVTKIHHAAADGVASGYLLMQLLEMSSEMPDLDVPDYVADGEEPSGGDVLRQAIRDRISDRLGVVSQLRVTAGRGVNIAKMAWERGTDNFKPAFPFMAPRTGFNRAISCDRIAAFGTAPLDDFRVVRRAFGCTINDVVLASCTAALRAYLIDRDDLPDKALIASVPVSIRQPEQMADMGNRVSLLMVRLPVHLESPVDQLATIASGTSEAKTTHQAIGADMLQDWAELLPPHLFSVVARAYSHMKLADRHATVHNLVVSNVPGPPFDLYCLGARVVRSYPLGPVLEGAGLNITVVSQKGNMDIGIIACPRAAPNPNQIAGYFRDAVSELRRLAEEKLAKDEAV